MTDNEAMRRALQQAKMAASIGEVPVGAAITYKGRLIGEAHNLRENEFSVMAHAEIKAIEKASKTLKNWRLEGCTLFVTLEPCIMCAGALIQSRIDRLVFAARDPKAGAVVSTLRTLELAGHNHTVHSEHGLMAEEASTLLKNFFRNLRKPFQIVDR